jgi:hypothetical protein
MTFFALHGAVKQVEELVTSDKPGVAELARKALEIRDKVRVVEEQVSGDREIEGQAPMIRFSRRLQQAINGEDLPDEDEVLDELGDSDIIELVEDDA